MVVSADLFAQPEVRVYYNKFEWAGLAAGYTVNRWRFEFSGSYHQQEQIGPQESGHPDNVVNGIAYPVFEDDVWMERTTTITGRIVRSVKSRTPWFGVYYGIYLRYLTQNGELTEAHWSDMENDYVSKYRALESTEHRATCFGILIGARGKIAGNFFWDTSLALLPLTYTNRSSHYSDGSVENAKFSGATYFNADTSHLFQISVGYKFGGGKADQGVQEN